MMVNIKKENDTKTDDLKEEYRIRKAFTQLLFAILFFLFIPIFTHAQTPTIQQQIDDAEPGETIELSKGEYNESVIINKPIHLIGSDNVMLTQSGTEPVISIEADHVVLENLVIQHTDKTGESAAILMHGDENSLSNLSIDTDSFGIKLDDAHQNELLKVTITGNKDAEIKNRKHGIDLYKSHNNEITDAYITHVQDGIYVEKSNENKIRGFNISHSRYGAHLMFTRDTLLESNESYENISGMYIMGADGTIAKDNILRDNQDNVRSLGMLLFDTANAEITDNEILNNRIGIFIEDASDNKLASNHVQGNYIGVQLKGAETNDITQNAFIANVVHGQARESTSNNTSENYWGDHLGLDLTGNHLSDIPYNVDPFFLNLTNEYPPFQLLFQAPGMVFLEELISTPIEEQLTDASPLMGNSLVESHKQSKSQFMTALLFCITLILLSTSIIYLGVKKQ